MIFLIESLIACAVFTLFVFLMSRDPIKMVYNYPPIIVQRCKSLGLVDESNRPGGVTFYVKKITAMAIFGIMLGLLVRYINGCTTPSSWTASGSATTGTSSSRGRKTWSRIITTTGSTSKAASSVCYWLFLLR